VFTTDSKAKIVIPKSTESNLNDKAYKRDGSPAIAEAQLKLAIAHAEQRDLDAARRHVKIAAEQAAPDWPHLESLGTVQFIQVQWSLRRILMKF
jgi:TPR repeat protein